MTAVRPKIALRLGLGLLVLLALFLLMSSAWFRVESITVLGNEYLTKEKVILASGLTVGDNLLTETPSIVRARLLQNPWIKQVKVDRRFPGGVRINITERKPEMMIKYYGSFLVLDSEFRVLELVEDISVRKLPVVTGVEVPRALLGEQITDPRLGGVLKCLEALQEPWRTEIAEVNIGEAGDLTLYSRDATTILVGQAVNLEVKMAELAAVWNDIRQKGLLVKYIDLRVEGQPLVTPVR
jgi:cell division protein FtsQ